MASTATQTTTIEMKMGQMIWPVSPEASGAGAWVNSPKNAAASSPQDCLSEKKM